MHLSFNRPNNLLYPKYPELRYPVPVPKIKYWEEGRSIHDLPGHPHEQG